MIDVDKMLKSMYDNIPNVDSELLYIYEANRIEKLYGLLTFLGLLLIVLVIALV